MKQQSLSSRIFSIHTFILLISFVIFAIMIVLTISIRNYFESQAFTHSESAFEQNTSYNYQLFTKHSQLYLEALEGVKGFVQASDNPTEEEWNTYIQSIQLKEKYSAIEQLYVLYPADQASPSSTLQNGSERNGTLPFEDTGYIFRFLTTLHPELINSAPIHPKKESIHSSTLEAMLVVDPIRNPFGNDNNHIIILLPFDDSNILGAVINLNELFEETFSQQSDNTNVTFTVDYLEEGSNTKIYESGQPLQQQFQEHIDIASLGGHQWAIIQRAPMNFGLSSIYSIVPDLSLSAGLIISMLTSFIAYFYLLSRNKSLQLTRSQLAQSEKKLRTLVETMAQGIVYQNGKGEITSVNKAAEEILGRSLTQIQGKKLIDPNWKAIHIDGSQFPGEQHPSMVALKTGKKVKNVIMGVYNDKDHDYRWISINAVPHFIDDEENPSEVFTTFEDITKIKKIEDTKDDFLSIAAHQLKTPLGSIRWSTELLLDGDFGKLPRSIHTTIKKNYATLLRLIVIIDDLLNVSRIDQNRVQDNPELTDVDKIIREAIMDIEGKAKENKTKIIYKNNKLPKLSIDPKRLTIVIHNLISNGVKYTPPEGTVTISTLEGKKHIKISVSDTGIGIPKKEIPNLFKKFYRGEKALQTETEGSGLGLFVVKSYIDAWNGKIEVESTPDKGSTFTIHLPFNPTNDTLNSNLDFQPHKLT